MTESLKSALITKIQKRINKLSEHYSLTDDERNVDLLYALLRRNLKVLTLHKSDKTRLDIIITDKTAISPLLSHMNYHDLFLIEDCLIQIQKGIVGSKPSQREEVLFFIGYFIFLIYSFQFFTLIGDAIFGRNNSGTGPIMLIVPFLLAPAIIIGIFQELIWKRKLTAFWRGLLGQSLGLGYLPAFIVLLIIL